MCVCESNIVCCESSTSTHAGTVNYLTGFDCKTITVCLETVSENEEKRRENDGRNFHSAVWLYKREER